MIPSPYRYPLSYAIVIIVTLLSLLPIGNVEIATDVPFADKWTHMVMYCGVTLVIAIEYARLHRHFNKPRCIIWMLLAPIAMGGILELLQAYATTYRSGEWLDFAADTLGCVIGAALGICISRIAKKR
ncbi:MAG: VanZ family protein [Bacteroidaceae bacterium]|nr:VanZ family protein [Bacteroidaceae bacterium]